ncbi:hypothetical protein F993_01542 [Acinetobacter proteolyticus]|uniref:HTH cro/C1-type domain-containing protein n=1 Tax=Acinetobacter proteolyticus TaxID=1776741 RepID=A0ABN0JG66_9GAMM|nr:helix-turn-helix domain-containing protein [Acinetobacter proteolyticus]ENU24226.1 hypothetical protein F993_01542 [Acinetobacter proteolyticus]
MTIKDWHPPAANEIKQLREETGFTQAKTAHLCRIGLKTYQKWEQGDASPSQSAWTIYMFELRAKKLGYHSLDALMSSLDKQINA